MKIKTTDAKVQRIFKSIREIDKYLGLQITKNNPIPTRLFVCPEGFDLEKPRYSCIDWVETSFLDFNLTLKLRNGVEVTLIKYYKYLESPLYEVLNQ